MAPPTPQRTPTGRALSSSTFPCASCVLRPSACHLEVAPTTTATDLRVEFIADSSPPEVDCVHGPTGKREGIGHCHLATRQLPDTSSVCHPCPSVPVSFTGREVPLLRDRCPRGLVDCTTGLVPSSSTPPRSWPHSRAPSDPVLFPETGRTAPGSVT